VVEEVLRDADRLDVADDVAVEVLDFADQLFVHDGETGFPLLVGGGVAPEAPGWFTAPARNPDTCAPRAAPRSPASSPRAARGRRSGGWARSPSGRRGRGRAGRVFSAPCGCRAGARRAR